jgi:hypothetical protein
VTDVREEQSSNAAGFMHINWELFSSETDESALQCEKHAEEMV